jgi:hypothetical protein
MFVMRPIADSATRGPVAAGNGELEERSVHRQGEPDEHAEHR